MFLGLGMNFLGINPIKALIYSAVLNGIVAPVILVLILLIARKKHIMGEWKNGKISATLGWFLAAMMAVSGIAAIYSLFP
jgi:Mn2+/Fe2+ NRAMP family transporter